MQELDDTMLASNLNGEPLILRGLTSSEVVWIVGISFVIWLPVALFLGSLLGGAQIGFGLTFLLMLASVVIMGGVFQKVKRSRPDGYWQHALAFFLEDKGMKKTRCVRRSGQWDVGRTKYFDTHPKK